MGSFQWVYRQVIICPDGTACGLMKNVFKTFAPWADLWVAGEGIFRDAEVDREPEEVQKVTWVSTPTAQSPGYFLVDLTEEESELPMAEAVVLYSHHWEWTSVLNKETSP